MVSPLVVPHINGMLFNRVDRLFSKKQVMLKKDSKKTDDVHEDEEEPDLYVERVRLEKMELRFVLAFYQNITFKVLCNVCYFFFMTA
jgi:hypothetical protein